jgi:hypothetical protein
MTRMQKSAHDATQGILKVDEAARRVWLLASLRVHIFPVSPRANAASCRVSLPGRKTPRPRTGAARFVSRAISRGRVRSRRDGHEPLLIFACEVGILEDGCSIGGRVVLNVERLAAVDVQELEETVARGRDGPLLAIVIVGGPDLNDCAVATGGWMASVPSAVPPLTRSITLLLRRLANA